MIDSHELRRRDGYLNKLIGFQDTEPVRQVQPVKADGSAFERYRYSAGADH